MKDSPQEIGASEEELSSLPGLLTDLALSLVPRRLAVAQSLLTMLGGYSRDKVRTLLAEVQRARKDLENSGHRYCAKDLFDAARELLVAVAKLEAAILTLVIARTKASLAPAPQLASI